MSRDKTGLIRNHLESVQRTTELRQRRLRLAVHASNFRSSEVTGGVAGDVRLLTHQRFMFAKINTDKWFEEMADDQARRRVAISDFTRRLARLQTCALIITGCAPVMFYMAPHDRSLPVLESVAAFASWIAVMRVSYGLRVLKLLERLSGGGE